MEIVAVVAGLLAGAGVMWWAMRQAAARQVQPLQARVQELEQERAGRELQLQEAHRKEIELNQEVARLEQACRDLAERQQENEKKLAVQFENLANRILESKSQKFTEQNKENLLNLLQPLKDQIRQFSDKVEKSNQDSLKWNATLKQQIEQLADLNRRLNQEAENLTRALKGDTKARGNWGEYILETILEKSGLRKGEEYFTQTAVATEEGRRLQPDVVLRLPEDKHIIIDSKVALVDYERYISAEDEAEARNHLKAHVSAVRQHVASLSGKDYQKLDGIGNLEFVLMFIPIEPAFSLAVQADRDIFNDALEKNIVIVSPSTLMATLRTIAGIWKNERQNKYALEIARQSGNLYDKFVSFTDDLLKVGYTMDKAKETYNEAMKKLSQGRGNLVGRAQRIKELGARASKSLDPRLLERADYEVLPENPDSHDDNTRS